MGNRIKRQGYIGYLYIAPWIIGFLVFMVYPLFSSLYYSFTDLTPLTKSANFVGLKNYIYMFTRDPEFFHSIKVTLLYALMAVPGKVLFALIIALIMARDVKGINFFRTALYLPSIFGGSVAISVLWRFLFQRQGTINNMLDLLSISPVDWLGNPSIALVTLALIPMWQFGSSMVLFLAAIKQVPRQLYESAKLDGAGSIRCLFHITLPLISPIILFNIIMQTIVNLQEFTSMFVITSGGPNKATYVLSYKLYLEGFSFFRMGYASALSWIFFLMILIFSMLVFKSSSRWVYYDDGGKF